MVTAGHSAEVNQEVRRRPALHNVPDVSSCGFAMITMCLNWKNLQWWNPERKKENPVEHIFWAELFMGREKWWFFKDPPPPPPSLPKNQRSSLGYDPSSITRTLLAIAYGLETRVTNESFPWVSASSRFLCSSSSQLWSSSSSEIISCGWRSERRIQEN